MEHLGIRQPRPFGTLTGSMLAVVLVLGLAGTASSADFTLRVDGMACPFCAFGIEKKLLDVPGVLDVEVYLDEGRIALAFESGSKATVDDLEQAVRKAGFGLTALSLETDGEIQREGQGDVRLVVHPGMIFRLSEESDGRDQPVSEESLRRMSQTETSAGQILVVEGTVTERDAREPRLVIRKIDSASRSSR